VTPKAKLKLLVRREVKRALRAEQRREWMERPLLIGISDVTPSRAAMEWVGDDPTLGYKVTAPRFTREEFLIDEEDTSDGES
jgi:hypothetical protein